MFQQASLQFLKDLTRHNQKEWFEKNRKKYESTKKELEEFTGEIIKKISKFDDSVAHLEVKECLFRINRDVRFSKDKSPYKNHMAMYISKGGKKAVNPGYYFHLEPGNSYVAGGLWMPMAPELKKVRQEIDYSWDEFKKIFNNRKFKAAFNDFRRGEEEVLSRPPKGYDENNAAIAYLKLKSWIVSARITDEELVSKDLIKKVAAHFETMNPMVQFFNQALDE
ncbi:MAG: DUF2461 domain-containing protein [Chitinophagaceae bacterium]|nr:DUF2461 domain-containing protein [Chitinophagaceae bacterium]